MEKYLNPYDKEVMKLAMMRHEETFKEQVYELHRLYRIQKSLMKNVESSGRNRQFPETHWRSTNGFRYDQGQQKTTKSKINLGLEIPSRESFVESNRGHIGENDIVLTLGLAPSNYSSRMYPGLETPRTSESVRSFSSSSSGSSRMNKTFGECNPSVQEMAHLRDMSLGYRSSGKSSNEVEDQLTRERLKQPSWLIKVLSLNMT